MSSGKGRPAIEVPGRAGTDASRALKLTAIYLVVGLAWIYFSDRAIEGLTRDVELIRQLQTWKGTAYVLITGALIYFLSWQALARQSRLIDRLEHYAYHNKLTGLPNRRQAEIQLQEAIARARRSGRKVGLIALDLDRFGHVNDSFGHAVGNELLQSLVRRLESLEFDGLSLYHPSADEFLLVAEDLPREARLESLTEKIRSALQRPFALSGIQSVYVTACIGTARFPDDADDVEVLLQYVDAALARAKHAGPDAVAHFDAHMVVRARRQVRLDTGLRRALDRGELELHFQPILACADRRLFGFEALMRWQPAGREPVAPSEFIAAAENSGLILALGDWALDRVAEQMAQWRDAGLGDIAVSINQSAREFESAARFDQIERVLERYRLSPDRLTLEITESVLLKRGEVVERQLRRMDAMGVGLALDDFGTGYSSLAYLHSLPVGVVKIDRSFVAGIEGDEKHRELAEAIVSLARIFDLEVVAEGVETERQLAILRELGCDYCQGYLLGHPMPADAAGEWLAAYRDQ